MKKLIAVLAAVILAAGIVRITYVNIKAERPDIREYEMGTEVFCGSNYYEKATEQLDGYSITVLSAKIVKTEDYLKEYNISDSVKLPTPGETLTAENFVPEYIYDVEVNIRNTHNTEGGINLYYTVLVSDDILMKVDEKVFGAMYPHLGGEYGFKLMENTDENIHLPFAPGPEYKLNNINFITPEVLASRRFHLNVTKYPLDQRINITPQLP